MDGTIETPQRKSEKKTEDTERRSIESQHPGPCASAVVLGSALRPCPPDPGTEPGANQHSDPQFVTTKPSPAGLPEVPVAAVVLPVFFVIVAITY